MNMFRDLQPKFQVDDYWPSNGDVGIGDYENSQLAAQGFGNYGGDDDFWLFQRLVRERYANRGGVPSWVQAAIDNYVRNQASGIQDVSQAALRAAGVGYDGSGSHMEMENMEAAYAGHASEHHASTYIPMPFRMRHHRVCSGRHDAMLGARTALTFRNKKSCAAFCRAWNAMMAHVGNAEQFIPGDLVQIFSDVIVGGSGAYGVQNEFTPPFKGRIS